MVLEKQGVQYVEITDASSLIGQTLIVNEDNLLNENNTSTGFKININK
jgi:hypothetical protein